MPIEDFFVASDKGRNNTLIPKQPNYTDAFVYGAASSKNITVPPGAAYAIIGRNNTAAYYVKDAAGAAVPGADVTDGTAAFCNIEAIAVSVGTISIATDAACVITIAWYSAT